MDAVTVSLKIPLASACVLVAQVAVRSIVKTILLPGDIDVAGAVGLTLNLGALAVPPFSAIDKPAFVLTKATEPGT